MKTSNSSNITSLVVFGLYLLLIVGIFVRRAWSVAQDPVEGMTGLNDDIMRLLSVRAWMDGQGWFDMTQYRVLAPDGISMHWSRYVDLGIAALIKFFALFAAKDTAETLAIVLWPQLMLVGLVGLTAWAGNRVLGFWPAATAVLALLLWPIIAVGYFEPLRLDHHNIQILLMTILIVTLILPTPSVRLGIFGGLSAAFSLAIGLENLIPIALAGVILCVEVVREPTSRDRQLTTFGIALGAGSVLFHVGQTHPDEWLVQHCDKLSLNFIGLTLTAALASTVLALGCRRLPSLAKRIGLLAACTVVGAGIVVPLLYPCLAGPYGDLPPELQNYVQNAIGETKSAIHLILNLQSLFNWVIAPAMWVVGIATVVWIRRLRDPDTPPTERRAVAILLLFGLSGVMLSLVQFRMIVLAIPPVPLLAGYGIFAVFSARKKSRAHGLGVLALLVVASLTFFYPTLIKRFSAEAGNELADANAAEEPPSPSCHSAEPVRALAEFPQGKVLARDRISTTILLTSDHTILAVPYHRSPDALKHLFSTFYADEEGFRADLAQSGADYLVLCRDETFGKGTSFASQLATGAEAEGLEPLPLPDGSPLLAFRVVK